MPFVRGVRSLRRAHLSARLAHEQGARRGLRAAGRPPAAASRTWFDSLPAILGARDLRRVVSAIVDAKRRDGGIVWGIGAHVIKTGVSPVLIDLMERGYVSALAMNGAGIIHDFEIALSGATSEDVDDALGPGRFGMAEETGRLLNEAIRARRRAEDGPRPGGRRASSPASNPPHAGRSLAVDRASARHSARPCTWRSAPTSSTCIPTRRARRSATRACAISATSRPRWRAWSGGVYLNCGSAVVLPEVFLKAVALARNQGVAARRADDGQHRFPADVPAADQRRDAAGRRHRRHRDLAGRPPRDPDSADRGGRDQSGRGLREPRLRLVLSPATIRGSCRSSSAG